MQVECGLWYLYSVGKNEGVALSWNISCRHISDWATTSGMWGLGCFGMRCGSCHLDWDTPVRSCILYVRNQQVKSRNFAYIFKDTEEIVNIILMFLLHVDFFLTFYRMQCARRLFQLVNILTVNWLQKQIGSFKIL